MYGFVDCNLAPTITSPSKLSIDSRRQLSAIAQLVERLTVNQVVTGSSPVGGVASRAMQDSLMHIMCAYKLFSNHFYVCNSRPHMVRQGGSSVSGVASYDAVTNGDYHHNMSFLCF